MSLTLTTTRSRPVDLIDLTGESPIAGRGSTVPNQLPPPTNVTLKSDLPPAKRRRIGERERPARTVKQCLRAHVLPSIGHEIKKLSPSTFKINALAEDAIIAIAQSTTFRKRVDQTRGYLTAADEANLNVQIQLHLQKALLQTKYQLRQPIPTIPSSPKSETTDDDLVDVQPPARVAEPLVPRALISAPSPLPPKLVGGISPVEAFLRKREEAERSQVHGVARPKSRDVLKRPYCSAVERDQIRRGVASISRRKARLAVPTDGLPVVYHVDFTDAEIADIVNQVNRHLPQKFPPNLESLRGLIAANMWVPSLVETLPGRTEEDIRNFCTDVAAERLQHKRQTLSLQKDDPAEHQHAQDISCSRISSLLLAREMEGNAGFGRMRRYVNFRNEFTRAREEGLDKIAEFTNCAGDIATMTWVSNDKLICGTTTHSDTHNQQYNKPGNLLLCSVKDAKLQAYPDHRIPRPRVEKGENSTEAMRRSQDAWIYSSVVSSDYDPVNNRAYTSSFDKTVKVWHVKDDGAMDLLATWYHDGNVNFVVASKDGSGRVATAADVPQQAVRIYTVDPEKHDIADTPYEAFSCSRTDALDSSNWSYYPATMQWGKSRGAQHLLAVGYSPRAGSGDDSEIPEDKRDSGEIALWDAHMGHRVPLTTATTANVFEVTWHPTLPRFICATSPCGTWKPGSHTQVHLFEVDRDRERERGEQGFREYGSLDCPAADINELTFEPNSLHHAYVTAACTDGKVYVWDTARLNEPMHVLKHGDTLDGFDDEFREKLDTGVKFTGWGSSPDCFYTGSSDGVVKVWNVRNRRKPYVRTLLEAPAPISSGQFSRDMQKLAIGDATGRVYLFSLDKRDEHESQYVSIPGSTLRRRRPVEFIPHAEPAPPPVESTTISDTDAMDVDSREPAEPEGSLDDDPLEPARTLLAKKHIVPTGDKTIGMVQGPNYPDTGYFLKEAHEQADPLLPLLTSYERFQQQSIREDRGKRRRAMRRLIEPASGLIPQNIRAQKLHKANVAKDLDISEIDKDEIETLVKEGALLSLDGEEGWEFEYEDMIPNEEKPEKA